MAHETHVQNRRRYEADTVTTELGSANTQDQRLKPICMIEDICFENFFSFHEFQSMIHHHWLKTGQVPDGI